MLEQKNWSTIVQFVVVVDFFFSRAADVYFSGMLSCDQWDAMRKMRQTSLCSVRLPPNVSFVACHWLWRSRTGDHLALPCLQRRQHMMRVSRWHRARQMKARTKSSPINYCYFFIRFQRMIFLRFENGDRMVWIDREYKLQLSVIHNGARPYTHTHTESKTLIVDYHFSCLFDWIQAAAETTNMNWWS